MDMLNGMRLFTEVVKTGSFAAAGRKLGMVPSSMSRQINALEETLNARLLNRSTRKLSLTEVGQLYYEQATRILSDLEDANLVVSQFTRSPRGTLSVSTPASFGRLHLVPALTQFLARHPNLSVDLTVSDQMVDMIEAGIDVAVHTGNLRNSSLIARKLATDRLVICASPAYLEQHAAPKHPRDLTHHNCLTHKSAPGPVFWTFKHSRGLEQFEVSGNLQVNSVGALEAACSGGLGLAMLPIWSVTPLLKNGELKTLLPEYTVFANAGGADEAIYAVYPHRKHISPKVRAFLDFMVEHIGDPPCWEVR